MKKSLLLASSTLLLPGAAFADLSVEPYGSLRVQAEHVSVDQAKAGEDDSYTDIRDAYSRFGVNASYPLSNGTTLGAKVEIPFNVQQLEAGDPAYFESFYKSNNSPRVAKVTASGNWGSVAIGKQWLAYYNNVAYPVDYFSSFYSGFATHATFRRDAVTYTTPTISGFSATASAVDMVHNDGDYLDSAQYAASYSANGFTFALGYQDEYGTADGILGAAASYSTGPWRFAAKYEKLMSPDSVSDGEDPVITNLYASYTLNNYTFKGLISNGDESDDGNAFFQGTSYHLGVDYQYNKDFKVFMEYFYEDHGYAIYTENSDSFDNLAGYHGETDGNALALGLRYDF